MDQSSSIDLYVLPSLIRGEVEVEDEVQQRLAIGQRRLVDEGLPGEYPHERHLSQLRPPRTTWHADVRPERVWAGWSADDSQMDRVKRAEEGGDVDVGLPVEGSLAQVDNEFLDRHGRGGDKAGDIVLALGVGKMSEDRERDVGEGPGLGEGEERGERGRDSLRGERGQSRSEESVSSRANREPARR